VSDERSALINYISDHFAQEDYHLKDIIFQQEVGGGPMMNIGPDQGKFLYLLMKMVKPKTVLEIGSYFGYSAVWLARALSESSMLTCVESSGKQCQIIKENLRKAGLDKVTQVLEAKGLDVMQKFVFEKETFDVIFIDADKKNYPNYFALASKLLVKGGVLLVDNCIWYGKILDESPDEQTQAIIEFNRLLAESKDFESTLLTVQDGLCLGIRL
jgi:predicted O-methyltransferase YrrM